jgi:hypothetical protein
MTTNTGNRNTGNRNTGDYNTGYYNTGYYNTGYYNTGNYNTGYYNTGYYNTGNRNTGNRNTGDYNTTNFSAGIFNTVEQKTPIFNGAAWVLMSGFRDTQNYQALFTNPLILTQWVSHSEATPEQKALDNYIPEQGVLVSYTWKEACLNWWDSNDEETKKLIIGIEGFDTSIFKEVTGIDLNIKQDETSERIKALEEQLAQLKASIHKATE